MPNCKDRRSCKTGLQSWPSCNFEAFLPVELSQRVIRSHDATQLQTRPNLKCSEFSNSHRLYENSTKSCWDELLMWSHHKTWWDHFCVSTNRFFFGWVTFVWPDLGFTLVHANWSPSRHKDSTHGACYNSFLDTSQEQAEVFTSWKQKLHDEEAHLVETSRLTGTAAEYCDCLFGV